MRTETIKIGIYKFEELPEKIQEKVFQNWLKNQASDYFWNEENKKSLEAFEKIFPIKIKNWEYGGYGRNDIDFEMLTSNGEEDFTGSRLLAYIYNNFYHYIAKGEYYYKNGKSRRSKIFKDYSCSLTGYGADDYLLKSIVNLEKNIKKNPNYSFYDLIHDCLYNWINCCGKDYEYFCSEEYFKEEISANGYEYTSDGKIYL